jgi:CubicO group peptidase (beta-lactamase class C family)
MIESRAAWVHDIETGGDRTAWDAGSFVAYFPGMPIRYRSQWYVLEGDPPLIFGLGIHGQNLFVERKNEIVIAKLSSQALPLDAAGIALTMQAVTQIRKCLA